ncbi:MAG: AAA family ATPase [Bdellovibrionales bacterium]|nr:AAA family ATPase [Ramlibacter sp.]
MTDTHLPLYAQFFGLAQTPFSIAPDPHYLYMSERHREALAHLLYGVGGGGGFVLLSGEIGTGKTTVCRCFLEQIPQACNVAYIFNPKLTAMELLRTVCDEFHVGFEPDGPAHLSTVKDYVDALNGFLLRTHAMGQNNVLIIDEAQNLSADVLEQLRLLTNLETNERKLLQIILIGQPELRSLLARPELEQLAQRVVARFHLDALSEDETRAYIQHRLTVAGLAGAMPFAPRAMRRIHQITRGVPRRINLLCDRAMLGAYATATAVIDRQIVDKAAGEVFEIPGFGRGKGHGQSPDTGEGRRWGWLGAGLLAGAALAVGVGLLFSGGIPYTPGSAMAAKKTAFAAPAGTAASVVTAPLPAPVAAQAAAASSAPALASSAALRASAAREQGPPQVAEAVATSAGTVNFKLLHTNQQDAWRALAREWRVTLDGAEPCEAAAASQLQCFSRKGSLALLRQLDRPALLELRNSEGQTAWAVLTRISPQTASLRAGTATLAVPLATLESMWQGEYATLWRTPPGYVDKIADSNKGATVDWLAVQLAALNKQPAPRGPQVMDSALKTRLQAFQSAQGIAPDGRAGPLTFMLLNHATGVIEPRLTTDR